MTVNALTPGYTGEVRDDESRFHGARIVYVSWDRHLMFTNPYAFMAAPGMAFGEFVTTFLAPAFGMHPDWEKIDWSAAKWAHLGESFVPDFAKSLEENGIVHKSALRFETPGLDGIGGLGI